tara:strand:- start:1064 stop:1831 length:768 start_codon:yes stop_codon:yes gene_type:complete
MEILESKELISIEINKILLNYNTLKENHAVEIKSLLEEMEKATIFNKKLLTEVSEKDKILHVEQKKNQDYEDIINKIQEEAHKELTEKERFSIMKAQDKEIHERDQEIMRLQKKLNRFEEKTDINIEIEENQSTETPVKENNLVFNEKTGEFFNKETSENNPNFIYEDDEQKEKEKETEVIEQENTEIDCGKEEDNDDNDDDDDVLEVSIIKYRRKEYYIIDGETPQYIYAIDDGEMGDKVGVIEGKKKVFYKII